MKKMFGTKLAFLLAAAVLAAGAFTACSSGDDGGPELPGVVENDGGLGGHIGKNLFKGLTLVYENNYRKETYSFTSDTKGINRRDWDSFVPTRGDSDVPMEWKYDFEYAVDSTKGLLKLKPEKYIYTLISYSDGKSWNQSSGLVLGHLPPRIINPDEIVSASVWDSTMDDWFAEKFGSLDIDRETKSLIYASFISHYHYKFSDDRKSVEMTSGYYFGDMAECGARFYEDDNNIIFSFGRRLDFDIQDDDGKRYYEGYPKFSGNTFTAVIFETNYWGNENYGKLSTKLEGTYQINGTGAGCTGTVTFTQLPEEFQDVFKTNVAYKVEQSPIYRSATYTVEQ